MKDVISIAIDANNKLPDEVANEILGNKGNVKDKIVTIRAEGILREGKPSDVNFNSIIDAFSDAYCVMRNTSRLMQKDFEVIEVKEENIVDIEKAVVNENIENVVVFGNYSDKSGFVDDLISVMSLEKEEGEKSYTFEERLFGEASKLFSIAEDDNKQD